MMNETYTITEIARLDWTDYTVFILMLALSIFIGIYFGCFGSKQQSADEYLLGGKDMNPIPVALSLIASSISSVTIISVPAEVYTDGSTYVLTCITYFFSAIVSYYFFIPIFYELNVITAYEYLEKRFNRSVRSFASLFYSIAYLLFLPAVVYIPSLTLSQVTGLNLHIISTGVTIICVFYTMIGGLKAVVWTDFLQLIVMLLAVFAIILIGTINVGGISHVLKIAYDNGRIDLFNFDPNPFQRNTFWTITIGGFVSSVSYIGTGQGCIQRYLSLSSHRNILIVMIIFVIGIVCFTLFSVYSGLVLFAAYYGCDPIEKKLIAQPDQIFPYFILDKIGYIPVLPGLFVAGVFSASLSSLSTGLNTIAGIIYHDYIKRKSVDESKAHIIMKVIIILVGIFSIGMVFLIQNMGKILSAVYILTSITVAPVFLLFTLGMFFPLCNAKGAIVGIIACTAALGWVAIGSSLAKINFISKSVYPEDTCPNLNITDDILADTKFNEIVSQNEDDVFILYKLSYILYTAFGLVVGLIFGIITSLITGPTDPTTIDPLLITPPLRRFFTLKPPEQELKLVENLIKPSEKYI